MKDFGLSDYDRLHFANETTQKKHFRSQLALAKKHSLPLFLHSRAAHKDFIQILTEEGFADNGGRNVGARGGVVHSFTGTAEEVKELVRVLSIVVTPPSGSNIYSSTDELGCDGLSF